MIIFFDGPQGVGKSTLIKGLRDNWSYHSKTYKFEFSKYSKLFNLQFGESLKGFQLGKDLATLYWLKNLPDTGNLALIDRGPLSTLYYSMKFDRLSAKELKDFIDTLISFPGNNPVRYIFITSKNRDNYFREKKDGFDGLDSGEEKTYKMFENICKRNKLDFTHFENDFSLPIEENIANLIKEILDGDKNF